MQLFRFAEIFETMKAKSIFTALVLGSVSMINGQVGINTQSPNATLDVVGKPIDATSLDGIIAPRISGDNLSLKTYTSSQTGALVYVTSAAGTPSGQTVDVTTVGYYYFNGDPTINKWIKITTGSGAVSSGWALTGNSGTVSGTHFLGTTDDQDLIFKRNSIQGGWLGNPSVSVSKFGNTAFGTGALPFSSVTGTQNTAFGMNAGSGITTGSNNIVIGAGTQAVSNTSNNQLNIGNAIFGTGLSGTLAAPAGYIGIGTNNPNRKLEVNAADTSNSPAPIRVTNLATLPDGTSTYGLVINPATGDVYANNIQSVAGQIIRLGINATSYNSESGLRFNLNSNDTQMGTAPNLAPNYINKIIGSTISTGVAVPAGTGAPARTTDRILLPIGVYRVTVRLVYSGIGSTFFIKSIVNGSEYSLIRVTGSSSVTTALYEDFINITDTAQYLDFTIAPESFGTLTVIDRVAAGTGQSYRSVILVERLR
ncbi:hypothetical protein BBH99_02565 [Chryseobacterium contaminans]|uniref:C1q domain-containing protein n=1 Tax=Chryseobacterium contaminans TaxID=1423959 RepID=A0A1M7BEX6_9FLAO|nr:hypothetical protein [Chryseobacterium contaminans]OCA76615.1 hypothetical protein BBH99_02565 [Chryseobacterium contaminans]SHL53578.1 hypothetical protein SAMN05444407_104350 [Chryseobacterium contaminans]